MLAQSLSASSSIAMSSVLTGITATLMAAYGSRVGASLGQCQDGSEYVTAGRGSGLNPACGEFDTLLMVPGDAGRVDLVDATNDLTMGTYGDLAALSQAVATALEADMAELDSGEPLQAA